MKRILLLLLLIPSFSTARQINSDFEKLDYLLKRYEYAQRLQNLNMISGGFGSKQEYTFDQKAVGEIAKKTKSELTNAIHEYFEIKN